MFFVLENYQQKWRGEAEVKNGGKYQAGLVALFEEKKIS